MKFAHLGDCHLGGWNEQEIQELNLKSFQYAISKCINEKVNFILIPREENKEADKLANRALDTLL